MKLQRYEFSCEKLYLRYLDELRKHRAEKTQKSEAYNAAYYRPSPKWFEDVAEENTKPRTPDLSRDDECDNSEATSDEQGLVERKLKDEPDGGEGASSLRSDFDGDWLPDSDHEDVASERIEWLKAAVAAAEAAAGSKPVVVEQARKEGGERTQLERGYLNKTVTGSKREKRRLRRLERESVRKGVRKGERQLAADGNG